MSGNVSTDSAGMTGEARNEPKSSDLITRIESAERGSRELDALIWLKFNRPEYTGGVKAFEMRGWYDGRGHMILETEAGEEVADDLGIHPVTTSLDAALALAERVLPGWVWNGGNDVGLSWAHLWNDRPDYDGNPVNGRASTPALALVSAILKAKGAGG